MKYRFRQILKQRPRNCFPILSVSDAEGVDLTQRSTPWRNALHNLFPAKSVVALEPIGDNVMRITQLPLS